MLLRGETAQSHIRAVVIVGPHPLRGEVLNFFNTGPVLLGYPSAASILDLQEQSAIRSYGTGGAENCVQ